MQNFVRGNRQRRILLVFFLDIYIYFTSLDAPDAVNKRVYSPCWKFYYGVTRGNVSVSLEKYISQGFEQNREDDRNIWKVYISVYPSLRDFWNSVSINIVSISFFFFFEGMRTVQVSMENLMFEFKYAKVFPRYGFCIKKKMNFFLASI